MSRYRKVQVKLWGDAKFRALSAAPPNGQTLFLYLIAGPHAGSLPGAFVAGEAALAEELGWPMKGFRKAFGEVLAQGMAKADWGARLIFLPKAVKHNRPENPNVVTGWRGVFDELPECPLKAEIYQHVKEFLKELPEPFRKPFDKPMGEGLGESVAVAVTRAVAVKKLGSVVLSDDQFIASLRENPAYAGLDITAELGKMDAWLSSQNGRGRKKTRRFVVNWLNRAEKPLLAVELRRRARCDSCGESVSLVSQLTAGEDGKRRCASCHVVHLRDRG